MAERPVLSVDGARQLRRTLKGANPQLLERLKTAHRDAADVVVPAARALIAPFSKSGRLAGSIRPGATKTAAVVRAGSKRIPYAGVRHYGWPARHIVAVPFLTEAAQQTEPLWLEKYHREVLAVLDTIQGATTP